jgi:predicted ATPase
MRRLLCLAALIIALGAIDWYAFHGRYRAAVLEDINYYAQSMNDGVQRFVKQFSP